MSAPANFGGGSNKKETPAAEPNASGDAPKPAAKRKPARRRTTRARRN